MAFLRVSLVMSLIVSYFVLSYFPQVFLDEIWDLTESVPENFPTYSFEFNIPLIQKQVGSLQLHLSLKDLYMGVIQI